jgi:hypothetical protein
MHYESLIFELSSLRKWGAGEIFSESLFLPNTGRNPPRFPLFQRGMLSLLLLMSFVRSIFDKTGFTQQCDEKSMKAPGAPREVIRNAAVQFGKILND